MRNTCRKKKYVKNNIFCEVRKKQKHLISMFLYSLQTDLKITANSRVIIITAGVRQKENESRLELLQRNVEILRSMVSKLVSYSPNAVLIVVSNPGNYFSFVTLS